MSSRLSRLRSALAAFWLTLFFKLAAAAPGVALRLKPFVVRAAFICSRQIRDATAFNADQIFGDLPDEEVRVYGRAVVGHFYQFVLDVGRSLNATTDELESRIESVVGHENYLAARQPKRGAIILTAHMGSFEVGVAALRGMEKKIHVVFKRDPEQEFERLRARLHAQLGVLEAPVDEGWTLWLRLREALAGDEIVAIQGDRVVDGQRGMTVPLLHGHVALPTGPVKLASASGAPIVPVFSIRLADNRLRLFVEKPIFVPSPLDDAALQAAMEQIAGVLAVYVRRYPEQWLVLHRVFCENASDSQ